MRFSILIPTRNRPVLVVQAIQSVIRQTCTDWELILVNDGSDEQHEPALAEAMRLIGPRGRRIDLLRRPRGHGQSFALNTGAAASHADYLCFLDDDDEWTDDGHLARMARVIDAQPNPPDLLFSNQAAFADGAPVDRKIWIEDLLERARRPLTEDPSGAYHVTPEDLLCATGFSHVNTTTIRRTLFDAMKGLDETILYECDRDFYLRAIDEAASILYLPAIVSRHNIPSPKLKTSMSTVVNNSEKRLFQSRVLDKAILQSSNEAIRSHARLHKTYMLKRLAQELAASNQHSNALYYAGSALWSGFNLRWAAYTLYLATRALRDRFRGKN